MNILFQKINKNNFIFNRIELIVHLQLSLLYWLLVTERHVLPKGVRIFQLLKANLTALRLFRVDESHVLLQAFHRVEDAAKVNESLNSSIIENYFRHLPSTLLTFEFSFSVLCHFYVFNSH